MVIKRTKTSQLFWLLVLLELFWLLMLLGALLLGCGNGEKAPAETKLDYDAAKVCALELVGDPDANVRSNQWNGEYYIATGEYNDGMNVFAVSFTISPCSQRSISIE